MSTREEQEARRRAACRHYAAGARDSTVCGAGIDVLTFNDGKREGYMRVLPCWGKLGMLGGAPVETVCDSYSPLTNEEIAARDAETDACIARCRLIRKEIIATGQRSGAFTCPCCESGTVRFSVASNGHVHAHCSTPKCASWME